MSCLSELLSEAYITTYILVAVLLIHILWDKDLCSWHNADDGTLYFDEKHIDGSEYEGPLATTASVVRGVASFAAVVSGKLNVGFNELQISC